MGQTVHGANVENIRIWYKNGKFEHISFNCRGATKVPSGEEAARFVLVAKVNLGMTSGLKAQAMVVT